MKMFCGRGRKLFAGICDSVFTSRMFVYPHPRRMYFLAGERGQDTEQRFPELSTSGSVRVLADWITWTRGVKGTSEGAHCEPNRSEYQSVCPFVWTGSPPPPPPKHANVFPPLDPTGGGSNTPLRVWGTTGQKAWHSVYLCAQYIHNSEPT